MARQCLRLMAAISSFVVFTDAAELQLRATAQARQQALEAEWSNDLAEQPKVVEYQSPIKRVVALLGKMKAELEHESKHEAEMYDKMVCWCETNDKEKTKAIADADAKDKQLSSEIESRSARFGNLETQIKTMKKEIFDLTAALKKATEIREKEAAAFHGEEKSLTQALTNIKNAIVILSKHQSFMQIDSMTMLGVKTVLRDASLQHELLTDHDASIKKSTGLQNAFIAIESTSERASAREGQRMNRELLNALDAKAAGGDESFPLKFAMRKVSEEAAKPSAEGQVFLQMDKPPSYSSGSGAVFGMLTQMESDFKAALAKAQEDEKKEIGEFTELSNAKSAQIDASKEKLDDLEDEAGDNTKALSDAKEDLEATREQRSADVKFLTNLKETCTNLNNQWEQRSKTRSQEIQAVSEAAAIISDDDNMDLMRGSVQFLQVRAKNTDTRRADAADVLRGGLNNMFAGADDLLDAWEGRHSSSAIHSATDSLQSAHTQLAALAITVKLDNFEKVKEAMDKLVNELKSQQQEEVEFKAKCVKDFNDNEKAVFKKTDEKEDLEAQIKDLGATMDALQKEMDEDKSQIADTQTEMKKASQNRESENAQFQKVVADQRATQDILKKALAKLEGFYKKKAFVQIEGVQTPPAQFTDYKKNSGASPVISMIQQIIEDSVQLEHESMAGEKQAQGEYTKFIADSNGLIKELSKSVVEKTKASADAKSKAADAKGDLGSANGQLESLAKVESDLHESCDFVLKNFEIRQKARATEMEAIQSAKGVLSGAK